MIVESIDYVTIIHHAFSHFSRRLDILPPFQIYLLSIFNPPRMFLFMYVFGHPSDDWTNTTTTTTGQSGSVLSFFLSYLSIVDIVVRWKRRRGEIAWNDDRLARVEHVMTALDENIGPSDNIVLGPFASSSVTSASSRRIVRKMNVARLWYKNALHIKWRQPLVTLRNHIHADTGEVISLIKRRAFRWLAVNSD
jgi:hypothetical protein